MKFRLETLSGDLAVIGLGFRGVVASTAPFQPREAEAIVFARVGDEDLGDLEGLYARVRREAGYRDSVVLLTSVDLRERIAVEVIDGLDALAAVSVGLEPPTCPGDARHEPLAASTINVAVAAAEPLSLSAALDLLRVAAEAKCLASVELLLRCNERSPGTVSDAIAVVAPRGGGALVSGMATRLGGLVSQAVYRLVVSVGLKSLGVEGLLRNALGIGYQELAELVAEAYSKAPLPWLSREEVKERALEKAKRLLSDPNMAALLAAARDLDLRGYAGALPGLHGFKGDPKGLVADELLGAAIAIYASGFKGLLAAVWVEKLKEAGVIRLEAGPFEDDAVSALVGSILSLILDEELAGRGWG